MPLRLSRHQNRIAQYITHKRQLKRSVSEDGKALFGKLAQAFNDQLEGIDLVFGKVGNLLAAFNIAMGTTSPIVPKGTQEAIVQVFKTALFGLELSSVEITYLDAGRSAEHPNGTLTIEFNEHRFTETIAAKMDLHIDAPVSVAWDFGKIGSPLFKLPLINELDLEDLEFYCEIFREKWANSLFWSRLQS